MNREEINYNVKERSEESVMTHGSVKRAMNSIEKELGEYEDMWSEYSGDGLGHAIECLRLMVNYLDELSKEEVKLLNRKSSIKKVLNND